MKGEFESFIKNSEDFQIFLNNHYRNLICLYENV